MSAPAPTRIRGSYRRPLEWPRRVALGFVRHGGHRSGVWVTIGRRGWYLSRVPATPCRHRRHLEDLQQRVDRTVAYFDELLGGPIDSTTRTVVEAARRSLLMKASSS